LTDAALQLVNRKHYAIAFRGQLVLHCDIAAHTTPRTTGCPNRGAMTDITAQTGPRLPESAKSCGKKFLT
jgi:hypothetical protein